ncbi:hypothetical protein [Planctomyces sp. SH-PL62]|uniref:hypothetical protein n=1 Tax=Planctomyces sp. SH-PL62 TaxID=1636152 RepID=UPI00078C6D7D|nr:hypothetical protein [Planctomyces sp. SH-PL62]AMV39156.1 hypothetical protein VT85_17090 [Planctomyces sp. SH-PL62]
MSLTRLRLAGLSAASFTVCAAFSSLAVSQDAVPDAPPAAASPGPQAPYPSHIRPQAHYPQQRRSVVQHYSYPYPSYYHGDASGGFRNPGGRGRYAEYFPAGDDFHDQTAQDPVRRAKFDQGGGAPDRAEQIAAYNAGTQRYNAIQRSIDSYARPYWGGGFGVGGFGGFW